MSLEDADGDIGPQAHLAVHVDRGVLGHRDLAQTLAQLVHLDVHGAREVTGRELEGGAHVQEEGALPGQFLDLSDVDDSVLLAGHVLGEVAQDVHGILGAGEGRRVGQFQVGQLLDGALELDGRGDHVDPLLGALLLTAWARIRRSGLNNSLRAIFVLLVVWRGCRGGRGSPGRTFCSQQALVIAGSGTVVKTFSTGCQGPVIARRTVDDIGHRATLAIGEARQRDSDLVPVTTSMTWTASPIA